MSRFRAHAVPLAATLLLAACSDLAKMVSPAGPRDTRPARVAFTASVAAASQAPSDVVSLRVVASYVLSTGGKVSLGAQTISLSNEKSQAVPIPVDLSTCLGDPARDGASNGSGCSVILELALAVNDVVVDRQIVGPLALRPGATAQVDQPVSLFEITALEVTPSPSVTLTPGGTTTLSGVIKDAQAKVVTGRTITWESDAPTVVSVDAAGKLTAVAVGVAHITASVGAVTSTVTATVNRAPVPLAIVAGAGGSGSGVVRSTPAGIDCRINGNALTGTCSFGFAADAQVTLTSVPDAGQVFGTWGLSCASNASANSCTLTLAQGSQASAQFSAQRRLSISSTGTDGRGRVTGAAGIDCRIDGASTSGACSADVVDGTALVLTATPDAASGGNVAQVLAPWGADCVSAAGATCTVTLSGANKSATVGFFAGKALSVALDGNGGGAVTSSSGIACNRAASVNTGTCSQTLSFGASVTLTATGDAQSDFVGWSGACVGQSPNCTVLLTQVRAATASFSRKTFPLTMTLAGSGNGTVTVNGVVECSRSVVQQGAVTCVKSYDIGTAVSIVVTPGVQTDFNGNSGDCFGTATCTLVLNAARSVTSAFVGRGPQTLTIASLGGAVGSGVVRSTESTPLIDCAINNGVPSGPKCSATVPAGTAITLRATGNAANALQYWGGGCNGRSTHECTVVMDVPLNVWMGFTPAIDVEMKVGGAGGGTVTFQPDGAPSQAPCVLSVGGAVTSCRFSLPTGGFGVFRGTASTGFRFDGFVGPCSESSSAAPVPVCTYRGIGFVRIITAMFSGL